VRLLGIILRLSGSVTVENSVLTSLHLFAKTGDER
jgi:hypothetical protein